MKAQVVYYSRTGNTKKVAEAIAEAVGCTAESVDTCRVDEPVDVLFLGGAVYATYQHGYHPAIRQFLKDQDSRKVKKVAVFVTFAFSDSIGKLEDLVKSAGFVLASEKFACKGKFLFWNLRRPDKNALQKAKEFAKRMTTNVE